VTPWTLVKRGLRHYWRTHLGVVLGAAVSTAILVGALVVGDSVRYSLRSFALARLGAVRLALAPRSRFFRAELADDLEAALNAETAPVLHLRGTVKGKSARANGVQVLGVDERFWALGGIKDPFAEQPEDGVVLNDRLARQLGVQAGDEVLLRVEKPSVLSRDAPLSTAEDASLPRRLTVAAVTSDASFGRYSLRADQIAPYNAFLPLSWLQERVGYARRANVILVGQTDLTAEQADAALPKHSRLADAGLELRDLPEQGVLELRTERVFLDPPVAAAVQRALPEGLGVLTYLVNELRVGERAAPYSMVAAIQRPAQGEDAPAPAGLIPQDMADDEILINAWLAKDLRAKAGDALELTYFVVGPMRKLEERNSRFRIRGVLPLEGAAADRELMPAFPGLANVDNCRDWPSDVGIDTRKIRPEDEAYWDQHRGTPKAFITLSAGQRLWDNRFGNLTAIRYRLSEGATRKAAEVIRRELDPASIGLFFQPVRQQALAASGQALDFGRLFLGLSFFLIVAAVLLMALLFVFGVEQRAEEVGTLLSLGFPPRRVRRLLLLEGGLLAALGGLIGTCVGTWYTRGVLYGLATVWRGAVARSVLRYHAEATTLAMGAAASIGVAVLAMWLTLRKQVKRPPRELLMGAEGTEIQAPMRGRRLAIWLATGAFAAALAVVAMMGPRRDQTAAAGFFGAGALLLVSGLAVSYRLLSGGRDILSAPRRSAFARVVGGAMVLSACICFVAIYWKSKTPTFASLWAGGGLLASGLALSSGGMLGRRDVVPVRRRAAFARVLGCTMVLIASFYIVATAKGASALGWYGARALLLVGCLALSYGVLWGWRGVVPVPRRRRFAGVLGCAMVLMASLRIVSAAERVRFSLLAPDPAGACLIMGFGMALVLVIVLAVRFGLLQPTSGEIAARMGWRGAGRRRGRSLAVVGLLACASFLVIAVAANRKDPHADAERRSSGTGGFALFGQSALPVFEDLNTEAGRETYALEASDLEGVKVVALRVQEGDDASCLNLNRAQVPRLLGVRPEELASRNAFTFVSTLEGAAGEAPWLLLKRPHAEGVVPAIGDDATVTWGLGKSVGDTLPYTDERGRGFKIRLVGVIASSILQGGLLIAEDDFIARFPSEAGYRAFLIDAPFGRAGEVAGKLTRALEDVGLELTPTAQRLAEFNTVENTYLSIFQALGGLGLLLGSIGLGVVVLRNVLERRGELAILRAVGFRKRSLQWLVLSEHWGLLLLGLACGVVAALIAVLPAMRSPGAGVPYVSLSLTLCAVVASGLLWTWLAGVLALRGRLLSALRNE